MSFRTVHHHSSEIVEIDVGRAGERQRLDRPFAVGFSTILRSDTDCDSAIFSSFLEPRNDGRMNTSKTFTPSFVLALNEPPILSFRKLQLLDESAADAVGISSRSKAECDLGRQRLQAS